MEIFTLYRKKTTLMLFLLLLLLIVNPIHSIESGLFFEHWNIHTIISTSITSNNHPQFIHITLQPIEGDADLFVSPCGLSVDEVVSQYIGYSFTHGIDAILLPMYLLSDMQENLCAFTVGKSQQYATYQLTASLVQEDDNERVALQVSRGISSSSQFGDASYNSQDDYSSNKNERRRVYSEKDIVDGDESTLYTLAATLGRGIVILLEFLA